MLKKALWITVLLILMGSLPVFYTAQKTVYGQGNTTARVTAVELNVRETPSGRVLGKFTRNTQLNISGREDNPNDQGVWVFGTPINGGISGWVLSSYLEFPFGYDLNSLPVTASLGSGGQAPATPSTQTTIVVLPAGSLAATPTNTVNFRSTPSLSGRVLRVIGTRSSVVLVGRSGDNAWVQAQFNGQTGWIFANLLRIAGDVNTLPVVSTTGTTATTTTAATTPSTAPPPSNLTGLISVGSRAREIYVQGQSLGNRRAIFTKIGDSMSASRYFLYPIGVGGLQLDVYGYLQPVVDFYIGTTARTHNSFANSSLAAREGWTTVDLLNPERAVPGVCRVGETPLDCEYRLVKPAVAIIMVGTNDASIYNDIGLYQYNLEIIVQKTIDRGIIPVLSTIPDLIWRGARYDSIYAYNDVIRATARKYNVPIMDYWAAMQGLPNYGLSGDNLHPSIPPTNETGVFNADSLIYGYNVRNLITLMMLDAVWRQALY